MISQNIYIRYETFNSKNEVEIFLKESECLHSNKESYKEDVKKLISYKEKHLKKYKNENKYRNIYAYHIKVLIPDEIKNMKDEFVKKYMLKVDKRFKKNLYIYYFVKEGLGEYVHIMAFTRYVYKKPKKMIKTYNRDFYYNSETKKLCLKNDPNAILKAKKGEPILDKEGNKQFELREVSTKEDRIFVYRDIKELTKRLKEAVVSAMKDINCSSLFFKIVSRITIDDDDSNTIKKWKRLRNKQIKVLNKEIVKLNNALILGKLIDSEDYDYATEGIAKIADALIHKERKSIEYVKSILANWWQINILDGNFVI